MAITTYDQFKELESSRKITLAIMEASNLLRGWVLESGFVFRLDDFDVAVIQSIEDSGTAYTEVTSLATVVASTFFHDRANRILFLRASDDSNPNSRFLVLTQRLFFSDYPVSAAFDLSTGKDVFWEPLLQSTSAFGVELDNRNQLGIAIEGSGSVTFHNDADSTDTNSFWRNNYTKLFFENHRVEIYSWNDDLPITEAKLIFKGRTKSKKYSPQRVSFQVQDLLSELRGEIQLTNISAIGGALVADNIGLAKQRRIYGRVFGHRPTNIDEVVDGYLITGTVTSVNGSATLTGSGTVFLKEISPDDKLIVNSVEITVSSVASDTSLTLTEKFSGVGDSGLTFTILPNLSKPYINRVWKVAGHATRQPETTVTGATNLNFLEVASTTDLIEGDQVFIGPAGTGELATVDRVSSTTVKLEENLILAPSNGTAFTRPSVQNVRINNTALRFDRDFIYDATTGVLTLDELAEFNTTSIRDVIGTITFNSTRAVTGTGTIFDAQLQPGMFIRSEGEAAFFEILSIESPIALTLRVAATYSATDGANYKPVINFDPGTDVLSVDCLGLTTTGAKDGTFIFKAAQIVKHLIEDANITDIDTASFTTGEDLAEAPLGLVIPTVFSDQKTTTFRSQINRVNRSVFGSLIQNNDFELEYIILSPKREITLTKFREVDVLKLSLDTTNEFMAKDVIIEYQNQEYNPSFGESSVSTETDSSLIAEFVLRTDRTTRIQTVLANTREAIIFARRWRFVLEIGHTVMKIETKLQGMDLQIADRIEVLHSKLFERTGSGARKVSAIQAIRKSGSKVLIELEDLADAFSNCSTVTLNTANNFANSSEDEKTIQGYITENTGGMINNDENTFRLHRIW